MQDIKKVLVVDDDPELRDLLKFDFRTHGFDTVTVSDGAEALEYLQGASNLPDAIILDLLMPGVDGMTFLRKRFGTRFDSIPVIVLTVVDELDTFREAFELGIDDYVTKPFSPPHLITRVEHIQ